jgi:membrane dipeptidase
MKGDSMPSISKQAGDIHDKRIVIDGLGGSGFAYLDILAGGVSATHVTLAVYAYDNVNYVLNQISRYYGLIQMASNQVMLVEEVEDIAKAKREKKLGIIFGFQNAAPMGENLALLPIFHKLGVRIIQLTFNESNLFGCGCSEPRDTGLTSLGVQAIRVMNSLGILIDLSHTGHRTSREAIEASKDPVTFTHANPSVLKDISRNKPDDLISMVGEKGGVIGLTPYTVFCKSRTGGKPTLDDFLDQIDYVVQLVGVDHVGIGTDMYTGRTREEYMAEYQARYPDLLPPFDCRHVKGFSKIQHFPRVTEGLLSRGYSEKDCAMIAGGSFYSLFQKVWKKSVF